jgi:hypothetical protein
LRNTKSNSTNNNKPFKLPNSRYRNVCHIDYRYGPKFDRENKNLTITHQDSAIALLYLAHTALPVLMLIEHIIRHLDDVDAKPVFIWNIYEEIQLLLAVMGIFVLYFMTFEKSKVESAYKRHRSA